jgi:hypothetical protein
MEERFKDRNCFMDGECMNDQRFCRLIKEKNGCNDGYDQKCFIVHQLALR